MCVVVGSCAAGVRGNPLCCCVQPVVVMPSYGLEHGYGSGGGFELWDATNAYWQPMALLGLWAGDSSGATVQVSGAALACARTLPRSQLVLCVLGS